MLITHLISLSRNLCQQNRNGGLLGELQIERRAVLELGAAGDVAVESGVSRAIVSGGLCWQFVT